MEKGIFERLDVIREYGNKGQISHFEKYNKWKNKDTEASFNKTLDEIFGDNGNWETIKVIRKSMYKLGEKLEERVLRNDGCIHNGNWKYYSKSLDVMIVAVLELGINEKVAQTLNRWAVDFGIITEEQHDILVSKHHEGLRQT